MRFISSRYRVISSIYYRPVQEYYRSYYEGPDQDICQVSEVTIPIKALFKDMDSKHGFAAVVKVFFFVLFCHGHLILLIPTLFAL